MTIATVVLAGLLLTASITDVRWRRVYNWTTYPGVLLALGANGLASAAGFDLEGPWNERLGLVGLADSLAGGVGCGFVMLVCYVFFAGGVGGGDVKLLAMIGAFLGLRRGFEALLWTFVLGACVAILLVVWRVGLGHLLVTAFQRLANLLRLRVWTPLPDAERERWKTDVFLSPAALAAVVIVQAEMGGWL